MDEPNEGANGRHGAGRASAPQAAAGGTTARPLGTAVVTGGTSGIGLAIALGLVERGFGVVVTGRRAPVDPLPAHTGFVEVDHAEADAPDRLAEQLDDRFGPLSALVNNVGRRHNDRIGELRRDSLLETMSLNVVSHMLLTQRLAPLLAADERAGRPGGAVVNISSRLARVGMPGVSGYAATKGAINAFTVAAAVELAPQGIRVNAVAPGMTKTPLIEEWLGEQPDPAAAEAEVTGRIPLARLAAPGDIAGAVTFLASPESAYITGAVLPVDGGYTVG